jgi:hypothetical protein
VKHIPVLKQMSAEVSRAYSCKIVSEFKWSGFCNIFLINLLYNGPNCVFSVPFIVARRTSIWKGESHSLIAAFQVF